MISVAKALFALSWVGALALFAIPMARLIFGRAAARKPEDSLRASVGFTALVMIGLCARAYIFGDHGVSEMVTDPERIYWTGTYFLGVIACLFLCLAVLFNRRV